MQKIANEKTKEIDEAYKRILIFIGGNYQQKEKISETRSDVKNEILDIIVELSTAFKGDSRLMEMQTQIASEGKKYDIQPPPQIEKKKKSGSFLRWFLWWQLDPTELEKQIAGYQSLKITQSARGQSLSFLILSASITTIFILFFNYDSAYFVEVPILLLLGYFIYRGHQWAMIGAMILWSFEKFFQLYEGFVSASPSRTPLILGWWAIYMHALYLAFNVERLRKQKGNE